MADKKVPTDLDWVAVRMECSAYKMFKELKNGVREDVHKRNEGRQNESVVFELGAESGKGFSVFRSSNAGTEAIDFLFENNEVIVSDNQTTLFRATATVNDEGRCKFVVGNDELEHWQLRKKALEKLFFYK